MTFNLLVRLLIAGVVFHLFPANNYAQLSNHGNIWHFGNRAGLDFSSGSPVPIPNVNMDSYEGCAVWCDANGQLELYTNGGGTLPNGANGPRQGIIWNRDQQVMYNMGATQGGGYSSAQGAVILPKPGSPNERYVFTIENRGGLLRGLSYFVVDMSLNNGLGDVTLANELIYAPATECITAIPHANGTDFWILTIGGPDESFIAVPFTASGIGAPQLYPRNDPSMLGNVVKASPDGRFVCADGELYAFDNSFGAISFLDTVPLSNYTFSFSPESRYLYGFVSDVSSQIVRYDLSASDVTASSETITDDPVFSFAGLMQLAPDGNLYLIEQLEEDFLEPIPPVSLSVIRCPDGFSPELDRAIMKFDTDINNAGGLFTSLPNFPDYIFARSSMADTTKIILCNGSSLTLSAVGQGTDFLWSNGATTASIEVDTPGTYSVLTQGFCGTQTTVFEVKLPAQFSGFETAPFMDTCGSFPLTLRAMYEPGITLQWPDGSSLDSFAINDFGEYILTYTNDCGQFQDTFEFREPFVSCCKPFMPNAFTPNGDGANDTFLPGLPGCTVEFAELQVWSRWGERIFSSSQATDRWDGNTPQGLPAPSDVYVYRFRYRVKGQQEQIESGEVTLLR
jgi:gliding motility-associated-like protein